MNTSESASGDSREANECVVCTRPIDEMSQAHHSDRVGGLKFKWHIGCSPSYSHIAIAYAAHRSAADRQEIERLRRVYDSFTQGIRQAVHGAQWGFGRDHSQYVADVRKLRERAERAESELEKRTALLRRIVTKLDVILPKVNGIIGLQAVRSGNPRYYDGPSIADELAEARALSGEERDSQEGL